MAHSSRRSSSDDPPPAGAATPVPEDDGDVDATERFLREEFIDANGSAMVLTVPPDADEADLELTQPLPKAQADEFDEDLIRTHEMPMADDAWMQEILEPNEEQAPRARMPSRPEREGSGHFPHPALVPRSTPATRRSPSSKDLPPATQRTPLDETQARIREAYHLYFALCRKHAQAVVGEETFAQRLHDRLAKLTERYPREKIVFRPVVENGTVRVRVLLAGKK